MATISRFRIDHFMFVGTSRKVAIVIVCFKIIYGIYILQTLHTHFIIKIFFSSFS